MTRTVAQTAQKLTSRPLHFTLGPEVPRYWMANNPHYTHLMNLLSTGFPVGEKTFINALRRYQHLLTDPDLQRQIRIFNAQEGAHAHYHGVLNQWIIEQMPAMAALAEGTDAEMLANERRQTPLENLALTAAMEHLTAAVATNLLRKPALIAAMAPELRPLWIWHSIEEIEHKAVAFDVYQAVGGSRLTLNKMYALGLWRYLRRSLEVLNISLWRDGQWFNVASLARFLWLYAGPQGLVWPLLRDMASFMRPSFHPNDQDDSELLDHWQGIFAAMQKNHPPRLLDHP